MNTSNSTSASSALRRCSATCFIGIGKPRSVNASGNVSAKSSAGYRATGRAVELVLTLATGTLPGRLFQNFGTGVRVDDAFSKLVLSDFRRSRTSLLSCRVPAGTFLIFRGFERERCGMRARSQAMKAYGAPPADDGSSGDLRLRLYPWREHHDVYHHQSADRARRNELLDLLHPFAQPKPPSRRGHVRVDKVQRDKPASAQVRAQRHTCGEIPVDENTRCAFWNEIGARIEQ
ncbi:hypothetical protein K438DRAFT_1772760 [Mycena galopus ATCC 62051]|nr:hypothetical protein K438DRAFT_1772760 [Mycena galopus ATCC 62051]